MLVRIWHKHGRGDQAGDRGRRHGPSEDRGRLDGQPSGRGGLRGFGARALFGDLPVGWRETTTEVTTEATTVDGGGRSNGRALLPAKLAGDILRPKTPAFLSYSAQVIYTQQTHILPV